MYFIPRIHSTRHCPAVCTRTAACSTLPIYTARDTSSPTTSQFVIIVLHFILQMGFGPDTKKCIQESAVIIWCTNQPQFRPTCTYAVNVLFSLFLLYFSDPITHQFYWQPWAIYSDLYSLLQASIHLNKNPKRAGIGQYKGWIFAFCAGMGSNLDNAKRTSQWNFLL